MTSNRRSEDPIFQADFLDGQIISDRFRSWISDQYGMIKTLQKEQDIPFEMACLMSFYNNRTAYYDIKDTN